MQEDVSQQVNIEIVVKKRKNVKNTTLAIIRQQRYPLAW